MTADAALTQLVAAYQELMTGLRGQISAAIASAWSGLGSWDRRDVPRFVETVQPVVTAAQQQAATLTDSYIAAVGTQATGTAIAPAGLDAAAYTGGQVRGGVTTAEEFARPFHDYWTALGDGKSWEDARMAGVRRASDLADTDVALAARGAARDAMTAHKPKVVGYRRVLTGAKSCIFCAVASTRRYRIEDLMPLHVHCDCTVAPIWGTKDPGKVINRKLLDQLQQNTDRSDYWRGGGMVDEHGNLVDKDGKHIAPDDAVKIAEHGELGPVLVDPHHNFAGPDAL